MRFKIDFSYSGYEFYGYQKQPDKRTVQGELEGVLSKINNSPVKVVAAGRTDALVNALHQVAHFDIDKEITPYKLKGALNRYLPNDIYINSVEEAKSDFHARYMVKSKLYEYSINTCDYNPILRNQAYQYCKPLNITKIKEASKYLIGTHDFTTFACAEDDREDKIRTIYDILVKDNEGILTISFLGTGFLRYQIRNMVGLLIKIGEEKLEPNCIPNLIEKKDRTAIGKIAPAEGLTLININY